MKAVGINIHAAIQYKGIVFDSERPDLKLQVPKGGMDIQDEPVYWSLPDGRVVYWSLQQLRLKKTDEFFELNTHEAYREIAKVLGQLADHKSVDVPTVGGSRLHFLIPHIDRIRLMRQSR